MKTIEDLKKENTKDQLAQLYLQQCAASDDLEQQKVDLNRKLVQASRDIDNMRHELDRKQSELEATERKLKVVEEATRAGLAMLYPDAPIPSRNADQFGYGDGMMGTALRSTNEPTPQERLLVHILQEAI